MIGFGLFEGRRRFGGVLLGKEAGVGGMRRLIWVTSVLMANIGFVMDAPVPGNALACNLFVFVTWNGRSKAPSIRSRRRATSGGRTR